MNMSGGPSLIPRGLGTRLLGKCVASFPGSNAPEHELHVVWNLSLGRRLTYANFAVLWPFVKVFCAKFGGVASLAW